MDAGQILNLRRLRFPDPLEREFREDYNVKSLGYVRFASALLALVTGVIVLASVISPERDAARLAVWSVSFAAALCLFLFTLTSRFKQYMQAGAGTALFAMSFIQIAAHVILIPEQGEAQYYFSVGLMSVQLIAYYTMFRLRLLAATAVCWSILALRLAGHLTLLPISDVWIWRSFVLQLMANIIGMVACYLMEHSARRDFLLSHFLAVEQERSERLLLNVLPAPVAARLKDQPGVIADAFQEVTVLFADMVNFTALSARMSASEVVTLLNAVFSAFDEVAEKRGLEKIKTIGDAYMVVGGLPTPRPDHAEAVVEMALDMRDELVRLSDQQGMPLQMRFGIHTGSVVAGVIGTRKFLYDLWGDTVNIASRMESQGVADCIQITEATYERLPEGYRVEKREPIQVKGRGELTTYLVRPHRSGLDGH
jgi:class 3 adenylate cyclase